MVKFNHHFLSKDEVNFVKLKLNFIIPKVNFV